MMTKLYMNKRNSNQSSSSQRGGLPKTFKIIHSTPAKTQSFSIREYSHPRNKIDQKTLLAIKTTKLSRIHKGAVTVRISSNRRNQ
jgi:hypothetical protein